MTPGVFSIVGTAKGPLPIDDAELSAIQATVDSGLRAEPFPFIQAGDYVCIEEGPLRGKRGIVQRVKNQHRFIVSITLLQRSISIELDSNWLSLNSVAKEAGSGLVNPVSIQVTAPSGCLPFDSVLAPEQMSKEYTRVAR